MSPAPSRITRAIIPAHRADALGKPTSMRRSKTAVNDVSPSGQISSGRNSVVPCSILVGSSYCAWIISLASSRVLAKPAQTTVVSKFMGMTGALGHHVTATNEVGGSTTG
jgi:hypothetical protein